MQDRAGHLRERIRDRERERDPPSSASDYYYVAWPLHKVSSRTHARTYVRTYACTHRSRGVYIFAYHAIRSANIMRATRRVITLFRYTIDLCNCTASVLSLSPSLAFPPPSSSSGPFLHFSFFLSINIVVYDGCTPRRACARIPRIRVSVRAHTSRCDAVVNSGSL